ncbi:MAG: FAD-dependent oxidoreductase [Microthrixaceae bacterium]
MPAEDDTTAPIPPTAEGDVTWDETVDVVVVGLGAAGAATAIAAAEAGARVLVLERQGQGGGTSAMSGGIIYLGGGTATQRAAGFDDDPALMRTFLAAALGRRTDDDRLAAYCDGSVEHHDWLVDHGVPFRGEFWPEPGMEPPGTEGLVFTGGEDTAPYADTIRPVPRGHVPATPNAAGGFLMECLQTALTTTTAEVRTDARVRALVTDPTGRVVGVTATVDGVPLAVRATGGVVLASGGWAYNDALVESYVPEVNRVAWKLGTDADDGWGLRSCLALGARTESMHTAEVALPITPPRDVVRGVLVNGRGERFINEDTYFGHVGQAALMEQGGEVYLLFDEPRYLVNRVGMRATWVCADWDELAAEMELPEGSLRRTMEAYNAAAANGEDPAFGKRSDWIVPLDEPPFGAIDLRVGSTIYAGFPLGGVVTDVDGRVLRDGEEPVPGLFAVGRVAASLARERYCSGISLGEGTFFGRRAAAAAIDGQGT